MIVRIWTVGIAKGKHSELDTFANTISLPMFQRQQGCLGVIFTKSADTAATITLWNGQPDIDRLNASLEYQEVVAQIEASGILVGNHHTVAYETYGGYVDQLFSDSLANKG